MKYRYVLIIFVIGFILQSTMALYINVLGMIPNLILCLVILFSFIYEGNQGLLFAILFGILQDLCFAIVIGPAAISYFLVALLMVEMGRYLYRHSILNILLVSAIGTGVYYIVNWCLVTVFGGTYSLLYIIEGMLLQLILNSIVLIIIYLLIGRRAIRYPQDGYYRNKKYYYE